MCELINEFFFIAVCRIIYALLVASKKSNGIEKQNNLRMFMVW